MLAVAGGNKKSEQSVWFMQMSANSGTQLLAAAAPRQKALKTAGRLFVHLSLAWLVT